MTKYELMSGLYDEVDRLRKLSLFLASIFISIVGSEFSYTYKEVADGVLDGEWREYGTAHKEAERVVREWKP